MSGRTAERERTRRPGLFTGGVYVFALSQILLATLASGIVGGGLGEGPVLALQLVLFGLLGVGAVWDAPNKTFVVYALTVAGLVGVLAGVRDVTGELWPAVLVVGGVTALLSYVLHRYELVTLDLVEADP